MEPWTQTKDNVLEGREKNLWYHQSMNFCWLAVSRETILRYYKKFITNVFISMIKFFIKKYALSFTPRRDPIKQITVYFTWMCFCHYLFSNLLTVGETESFKISRFRRVKKIVFKSWSAGDLLMFLKTFFWLRTYVSAFSISIFRFPLDQLFQWMIFFFYFL